MDNKKIILDTSAYSAFLRGHEKIKFILQKAEEIYVNPIVTGELLSEFIMGSSEGRNREILSEFLKSPRVNIADISVETSERYAAIVNFLRKNGSPIPTNGIWIAASAMEYGLVVVTTDKHYLNIPLIITEFYEV